MSIIKATRAHYAALQHRASADRIPLFYAVDYLDRTNNIGKTLTAGTIQVKAANNARRQYEMTKLINRLQAMYPEGTHFEASFK